MEAEKKMVHIWVRASLPIANVSIAIAVNGLGLHQVDCVQNLQVLVLRFLINMVTNH
jgi:sporulation-control protein spo0M